MDIFREFDGRVPTLVGSAKTKWNDQEVAQVRALFCEYGVLLFRGFAECEEDFIACTKALAGPHGSIRLAPGADSGLGPAIGLHTEDAMLPAIPRAIWFYAVHTSCVGGETILCDGAAMTQLLSRPTREFLLTEEILYWWKLSAMPPKRSTILVDPIGIDRCYRGPFLSEEDGHIHMTAHCRALLRHSTGKLRIFANHILNAITHGDDGGPPEVDGFHRVRTHERRPLPCALISELQSVSSAISLCIPLRRKDILYVDNVRYMHGRAAFSGRRQIIVRKSYDATQLVTNLHLSGVE